jgi:hypothetical protein
MNRLIHWLENHQGTCSWKEWFGIRCPGCGIQTAFIELLKGNILASIEIFPALLPMILMLVFLVIHILFKLPKGAAILKFLFIFTSSIMVISYFVQIFYY